MKGRRKLPKAADNFRRVISTWPIPALIGVYLGFVVILAIIHAGVEIYQRPSVLSLLDSGSWTTLATRAGGYFMLLMGQDWPSLAGGYPQVWYLITSATTFSALLPALLLGTVVFRVLAPKTPLVAFDQNLYIMGQKPDEQKTGNTYLTSTFYIRTKIPCFHVKTQTFIKYFKRYHESDSEAVPPEREPFPWFSTPLSDNHDDADVLPAPYPLIPTRFEIPVYICRDRTEFENQIEILQSRTADDGQAEAHPTDHKSDPSLRPLLLIENGRIKEAFIRSHRVHRNAPYDREYFDLMVIVTGDLPDAQAQLMELHRYDIFKTFKDGPDLTGFFEVNYNRSSDRYQVTRAGGPGT